MISPPQGTSVVVYGARGGITVWAPDERGESAPFMMGHLPRMSEVGRHLDRKGFLLSLHVQCGAVPLAPVSAGVLVSGAGVGTVLEAVVGVLYSILHPQVQASHRPLGPEVSRLFCLWVLCRLHGYSTRRRGTSLQLPDSDSCLCYSTSVKGQMAF